MRILAKAASIIAIATASAIPLGLVAKSALAAYVIPQGQTEIMSGYQPPDDIGGPGSSQGSGTR